GGGSGGPAGAGGAPYRYHGTVQEGTRSSGGTGDVPQEQAEERSSSIRERHSAEHKPRRISVGTLLGKTHHPQTRPRDRMDSQSVGTEGSYSGEASSMPGGNIGGISTGGSGGHPGAATTTGGGAAYGYAG
ncbi:unnamed protein product, partial [Ectocarpus sp. 4 AP-2014]